ncbi:hypothetical protein PROFUN_06181 [Planoprotostelium fungivorum]|uniref:Uncharacterized protein n=1 Tax=Planoprotostelium fungivorum TaxID=1890364 RepID=A0A2P6MYY1_9EUKA|nr:hypothetical protein PROFUN_06181 [Planoprotostelium fungivorum]
MGSANLNSTKPWAVVTLVSAIQDGDATRSLAVVVTQSDRIQVDFIGNKKRLPQYQRDTAEFSNK